MEIQEELLYTVIMRKEVVRLLENQNQISTDARVIAEKIVEAKQNQPSDLVNKLAYYIQKTYDAFPMVKREDYALLLKDHKEYIPDD